MNKIKVNAIRVSQPLGEFFVISMKAKDLIKISFSEPLEYLSEDGKMKGNQRVINEQRLKEIGKYIDTAEMTFPNSIILSANQNPDGSLINSEHNRWEVIEENGNYFLEIPLDGKSASVIDGQHRINGFSFAKNTDRLEMDLVCSIFFDLPNPYQAYLFATINGNQKRVDKGLALEQFGYYVAKEDKEAWTPEKLAASISRKLNFNENSPLKGKIKISPIYNNKEFLSLYHAKWIISTAAMMEGILSLLSSNYKRDRIEMMNKKMFSGRNRKMVADFRDSSPLRNLFLESKDEEIEQIIFNFFQVIKDKLWVNIEPNSYIIKTIGIQALFSLLKESLKRNGEFNEKIISCVSEIDFSDNYFQASGIGKTRIRNVLFISNNYKSLDDLSSDEDKREIQRIINNL